MATPLVPDDAFGLLRSYSRHLEKSLSSLKEDGLTAEEANYLLGQSVHFGKEIYAKLRRISQSRGEK